MKYALRFAVFAMSAAFACATPPAPTTYNQSALRPPPAPRFSPVEDAPHTFKPGRPRPSVEPGPKPTRVLPETPETRRGPGIWAGDEPKAVAGPPRLEIAGVPLPVPEPEWSVNPLEAYAPTLCHALITHNAFSPAYVLKGDRLTPEQRACLVAKWYKHCLSWAAEAIVDKRSNGLATTESQFWKRYVNPASKFEKEKCSPGILNSMDRDGREPLKNHEQLPAGYWDDVYKSYLRTNQ